MKSESEALNLQHATKALLHLCAGVAVLGAAPALADIVTIRSRELLRQMSNNFSIARVQ
jgi:hypothetical protein